MRKLTQKEVIEKFRKAHGDKYDYSKVIYKNMRTKVCIICPIHGEFWQTPDQHSRGVGCRKCAEYRNSLKYRSSTKEFVERSIIIHGNKYDYSKIEYTNAWVKVCIICPIHGEFWQTPTAHLLGSGCPKCGNIKIGEALRGNTVDFSYKAQLVHGDKYDYSKVFYINNHTKVEIICKEHGSFWLTPASHLRGAGCPICSKENFSLKMLSNTKEFIEKAKIVHGDKYDYSLTEYKDSHSEVALICNNCKRVFYQSATSHLSGRGCHYCNFSHGELKIERYLTTKEIAYIYQYRINLQETKLFSINNLKVDFYLPDYNTIIEFNGIQHYRRTPVFHRTDDDFTRQVDRDKRLREYCKQHKINLIEIKYDQIDKIDKILDKKLKLNNKH